MVLPQFRHHAPHVGPDPSRHPNCTAFVLSNEVTVEIQQETKGLQLDCYCYNIYSFATTQLSLKSQFSFSTRKILNPSLAQHSRCKVLLLSRLFLPLLLRTPAKTVCYHIQVPERYVQRTLSLRCTGWIWQWE